LFCSAKYSKVELPHLSPRDDEPVLVAWSSEPTEGYKDYFTVYDEGAEDFGGADDESDDLPKVESPEVEPQLEQ